MRALLVAVLASVGVAFLQPALARDRQAVRQADDVSWLPPPTQVELVSLGYRAALVDQLWAKLLIEYGTHLAEKRTFEDAPRYLDAILALEPGYAPLFRYVDTLLCYRRPGPGIPLDARLARSYLERGTQARPTDHEVWTHYGQFVAFLAPSFIQDEAEITRWRRDGAEALVRAVELGADIERGLPATSMLSRSGERLAAIRNLERWYALSDDPDRRREIAERLRTLEEGALAERAERAMGLVEGAWRRDAPFVSRSMFLLLGPPRHPTRCVGMASSRDPACPADWTAFVTPPEP